MYLVRRKKDGTVFQYPPKYHMQVNDMIRSGDFELMGETPELGKATKEVPIIDDYLECPICGKVVREEKDLKKHKLEHK